MNIRAMAAAAMSGGIEGQILALLNAAGVNVASREIEGDEARAAFRALGSAASLPSATVLELTGGAKGKKLRAVLVIE
jgi:hypothetical protein